MQLTNEFDVPRPLDEAWAVLTDVERIAPCMPGAQLTEVDGDTYHGTVKVKVGPVVAQYAGQARFLEKDAENHRAVLEAKGKEKSGRGLANAKVTAQLAGQADSTHVTVLTDLTISGPLAQFGRGAIAEVSTKLLKQFVTNLRETVLEAPSEAAAAPSGAAGTPPAEPAPTATAAPGPASAESPESPESQASAAQVSEAQASAAPTPPAGAQQAPGASTRRIINSPEAQPADLLSVARASILKRVVPLVIVVAIIIAAIIIWV